MLRIAQKRSTGCSTSAPVFCRFGCLRHFCVYDYTMRSADIIARLKAEGWARAGGKGSHQKFKHPAKPGHVTVPHPRKDIPEGTLRNIFLQADWAWK